MGLSIRNCRPNDIEDIIRVESDAFTPEDIYSERLLKFLCVSCRDSSFVAVNEHGIVGYVISCVEEDKIHILSVAVLRDHWGKGIGKRLICAVLAKAAELGVPTVYLEARKSNVRALSLYTSLGFEVRGTLSSYYPNGEDGYLLVKALNKEDGASSFMLNGCGNQV